MSAIAGVSRRGFLSGLASVLGLGAEGGEMTTKQSSMRRLTVTSSKPFQDVVTAFEAAVGHPNLTEFMTQLNGAKTYAEMESVVQAAVSKAGFMQFARFDLGAVIRKENGQDEPRSIRYLVGNPLIMKEMVKHVPDAGSYAPVTVLIDERADAVHLSYDLMSAFLSPYGNKGALEVARDLDAKVESLLKEAAA
jgi:uncharacterized protein (DUF302 family)